MQCPSCNAPVHVEDNFCASCGFQLRTAILPDAGHKIKKQRVQAERRQLTVMFCDIVGSTSLSENRDPEEFRQMILDFQDLVEKAARRHDGFIAQFLGDGLLLYFGYPKGLEDASVAAVRCGLQILSDIEVANEGWLKEGRPALSIRIGVHTGIVIVDQRMAIGETTNLAARVQGMALPGTLLISEATEVLVRGWFDLRSIGRARLKGITRPVDLYEVKCETTAHHRFELIQRKGLSPLIGRREITGKLIKTWNAVQAQGGKLTILNAEAGIGKSRILGFLANHIKLNSKAYIIEIRCAVHQRNTAFHPINDVLERAFSTSVEKIGTQKDIKALEGFLKSVDLDAPWILPVFAEFFNMPLASDTEPVDMKPEEKKTILSDALTHGLINLASRKPVLLLVEDIHWADPSTLSWLQSLVPIIGGHNIYVLCSTRPESEALKPYPENADILYLPRLTAADIRDLCLYLAKGMALPELLLEQIIEKTEGIPLFVEELMHMVLDSGMLIDEDDHYTLRDPSLSLSIPSTLQDSLVARLDMLSTLKEVTQIAAVIGKEIPLPLLQAMLTRDQQDTLERDLKKLVEADLLYIIHDKSYPVYSFKHALIQDAAYQTLLRSKRQEIHDRVARVLQEEFPELAQSQPELLALHLTEAGKRVEAIERWMEAGNLALQRFANLEAVHHYEQARTLLKDIPISPGRDIMEIDVLLSLGGIYSFNRGYTVPEVSECFNRAVELCLKLGDVPELFYANYGLASYCLTVADFPRTKMLTDQLRQTASLTGDQTMALAAYNFSGSLNFFLGNFSLAKNFYSDTIKFYDADPGKLRFFGHGDIKTLNEICFALIEFIEGDIEESLTRANGARELALEIGENVSIYYAFTLSSFIFQFYQQYEAQEKMLQFAFERATKRRDPFWVTIADFGLGCTQAFLGFKEGLSRAFNAIGTINLIGLKNWNTYLYSTLAEVHLLHYEIEQAQEFIAIAEAKMKENKEEFYASELFRVKARINFALGKSDQSLIDLQNALEIAIQQGAPTWELKCCLDILQFHKLTGMAPEAEELLLKARLKIPQLNRDSQIFIEMPFIQAARQESPV